MRGSRSRTTGSAAPGSRSATEMAEPGSQPTISAVILAHDEVDLIRGCVESVAWADETLVISDGTTDQIAELAGAAGARVIVRPWQGFPHQRNAGLALATADWLLFVDA